MSVPCQTPRPAAIESSPTACCRSWPGAVGLPAAPAYQRLWHRGWARFDGRTPPRCTVLAVDNSEVIHVGLPLRKARPAQGGYLGPIYPSRDSRGQKRSARRWRARPTRIVSDGCRVRISARPTSRNGGEALGECNDETDDPNPQDSPGQPDRPIEPYSPDGNR
jgi:hypothetical protein